MVIRQYFQVLNLLQKWHVNTHSYGRYIGNKKPQVYNKALSSEKCPKQIQTYCKNLASSLCADKELLPSVHQHWITVHHTVPANVFTYWSRPYKRTISKIIFVTSNVQFAAYTTQILHTTQTIQQLNPSTPKVGISSQKYNITQYEELSFS